MSHEPTAQDLAMDVSEMLDNIEQAISALSATMGPNAVPSKAFEFRGLCRRVLAAEAERDKLQAFKDWVHGYLDTRGVPHHPPGTHGAEGCRIGDRMDWLMERLERAEAAAEGRG